MKEYFPVFLHLRGKKCLVVGGGEVATRKVKSLLAAKARVLIVSPRCSDQLQKLEKLQQVKLIRKAYRQIYLRGVFLVIAAAGEREVNQQVWRDCLSRRLLVNVADDPCVGNFFMPAVVSRGSLSLAISTEGRSPAFARRLKEELEQQYGPEYGEYLEVLGDLRERVKARVKDPVSRRRLFQEISGTPWFDYFLNHPHQQFMETVEALIRCHSQPAHE